MNMKKITLKIGENEFNFNVTVLAYNTYVNDITQQNKIAPSDKFVKRTIEKDQAESLKNFIDENPGATIQIAGKLVEEFAPDLAIEVKN